MTTFNEFLQATEAIHKHLCPRQVLGVRMGILAGTLFSLQLPQEEKRLLTISETDGCFVDGISVVTNCTVGHRTLRIEDYGKIAATFVDTTSNKAFRLIPRQGIRVMATQYAPPGIGKWEQYLIGYQHMPDDELLAVQEVELTCSLKDIMSRPGVRTTCTRCGEEIINEREVTENGFSLCKPCMFGGYYRVSNSETEVEQDDLHILQHS